MKKIFMFLFYFYAVTVSGSEFYRKKRLSFPFNTKISGVHIVARDKNDFFCQLKRAEKQNNNVYDSNNYLCKRFKILQKLLQKNNLLCDYKKWLSYEKQS